MSEKGLRRFLRKKYAKALGRRWVLGTEGTIFIEATIKAVIG